MALRAPTEQEISILDRLLAGDFLGVAELRVQAEDLLVEDVDHGDDCGTIVLHPVRLGPADLIPWVLVQGYARDEDGVDILFVLHTRSGILYQLETVKLDGTAIKRRPAANEIETWVATGTPGEYRLLLAPQSPNSRA